MPTITTHCVIKNEENFIWYAIKSVVDCVDKILIFDTGSTDKTVEIIKKLVSEYPDKIIFEEKGECTKQSHTELRQEMLDRTTTDWFMILDGDEVWTTRGIKEALKIIFENSKIECLIAQYYLCVGDIFHHSIRGKYEYFFKYKMHASPRFFKIINGIYWNSGPYGNGDYVRNNDGDVVKESNSYILNNKYWHCSALIRSKKDNDVSIGRHKQVITYSLKIIGEGIIIKENIPEVFHQNKTLITKRLSIFKSWFNLGYLILFKLGLSTKRYIWIN